MAQGFRPTLKSRSSRLPTSPPAAVLHWQGRFSSSQENRFIPTARFLLHGVSICVKHLRGITVLTVSDRLGKCEAIVYLYGNAVFQT
jgi:hypothetical protein